MKFLVPTQKAQQIVPLTDRINEVLGEQKVDSGICTVFVTHTTCALTTGELGEGTAADFLEVVEKIIPEIEFRHAHDPKHAWQHMAASLIGSSLAIPFENQKLSLGTWQDVLLVELNGPRERIVKVEKV